MTPQERSESARRAVMARWTKSSDKRVPKAQSRKIDPQTRRAVEQFLALIRPRFVIAKTILYGSRARGEHRPDSDADLAIVVAGEPESTFSILSRMAPSALEVLLETGISISPLPVTVEQWAHPEDQLAATLFRNIAREGIGV